MNKLKIIAVIFLILKFVLITNAQNIPNKNYTTTTKTVIKKNNKSLKKIIVPKKTNWSKIKDLFM